MSNYDWMNKITDVETKLNVEAFSETADIKAFSGVLVDADRPQGGKKINYPLRIEESINAELDKCKGSKNAVINLLLKYAIADLKEKNKTLYG